MGSQKCSVEDGGIPAQIQTTVGVGVFGREDSGGCLSTFVAVLQCRLNVMVVGDGSARVRKDFLVALRADVRFQSIGDEGKAVGSGGKGCLGTNAAGFAHHELGVIRSTVKLIRDGV